MGIYRSTNPAEFDDIDGIIINEQNPPGGISGVAANTAIIVGQCQRGPTDLSELLGSVGEFHEIYGKSSFGVNLALKNKRFGALKVIRAVASAAAKATIIFESAGEVDIISFTAKYKGAYGNNITVTVAAGTTTGKKYTVHDGNTDAVLPDEVYDDVVITAVGTTFSGSKLVDVAVIATSAEPANASATSLATGSDGSIADTDYQTAIALAEVERAGNFLFLDAYNSTRCGYLETHALAQKDKMVILAGAEGDSVSTAASAAAGYRSDFIIYGYPWVKTVIDDVDTYQSPASWIASILSQTSPHIDPAYVANSGFVAAITGLKLSLTRANYVTLNAAGIMAFEMDPDIGPKIKNGVTTEIVQTGKKTVLRRRMASYLQDSIAYFLKQYQNAPNTTENRTQVKGAILSWISQQERDGILPTDADVKSGSAKVVDTESLNTDDVIAAGFFKILYRQRINSSMRYIVLQAEVGEGVVVTEV